MLTYILIGAVVLLLASTCYLVGYTRSQGQTLSLVQDENFGLALENSTLREKVTAHETSLTMLLNERRRAS